jgi:mRNA interferase MazF
LPDQSGSEEYGRRFVVIVSNDKFNQDARWNSVIGVAITKSTNQATRASVVFLPRGTANLRLDSYAICHQVFVLDKNKLDTLKGTLPDSPFMRSIENGLKVALFLP